MALKQRREKNTKENKFKVAPKTKKSSFVYPKKPSGKLYTYRKQLSYLLLVCLFVFPHLRLNGEQLVLINFLERKFVFFGLIFTPQDFYLFAVAMLACLLFVVFFTLVLGRLWCGWVCPQTIFMEMLFRRIEYWIEGDANQQIKLDKQPLNLEKATKKTVKHTLFIIISFLIANTFLAYLIGSKALYAIITEPVGNHLVGFFAIWLFTFVFYFIFAYVRESVCTVICPYGRLQGVLLDNDSVVVAYDVQRGEPRGKRKRDESAGNNLGDCVDCGLCVQVCPTDIDIRKGTQMECVNCTACIDACNQVMDKLGRDKNLIGFYNQDYLQDRKAYRIKPRTYIFSVVVLAVFMVLSGLIYARRDVEITVLRASGTLYQTRPDGSVSNLYNAQLVNKTNKSIKFKLVTTDKDYSVKLVQQQSVIPAEGTLNVTFFIIKAPATPSALKTKVHFEVKSGTATLGATTATFFNQAD